MNRRHLQLAAALALLSTAALGIVLVGAGSRPSPTARAPAAASPSPSSSPRAAPSPSPLDPLTIAAMRARSYPASALVEVKSDGDMGGYVTTVDSFVSDGLTEYTLVAVPDGTRPAAGWPVVIINHGYIPPTTYVTDDASYGQFIAVLARAGYMVLKPDYRGNGRSQGVAAGAHLSPVYTWDLLNLISTVRADPRADPTRIGLFGHSMGGHEALRAMVVAKNVRAVVLMAGVVGSFYDLFYNWPHPPIPDDPSAALQQQVGQTVVDSHGPPTSPTPTVVAPSGSPAGGSPTAQPSAMSFWDAASAINFVGSSNAAVQIDQDVADSQVPKLFADHLAAALQAAGRTYQYLTYPGDDHQFTHNRAAVLANIVAFYRAHL